MASEQDDPVAQARLPRRLLFAAAGGHGHLQPLLPLAEQARRAGHDVLVTGAAALGRHVSSRGLAFVATGPELAPISAPLVVRDLDEEREAVGSHFVARLGGRAARLALRAVVTLAQPSSSRRPSSPSRERFVPGTGNSSGHGC